MILAPFVKKLLYYFDIVKNNFVIKTLSTLLSKV